MTARLAAAILLLAGTPAFAHRLDEYLQGTILSVEKDRLRAQMTLTPGVAVFAFVAANIDTDADGAISATEQRAYGERVLRDLSLVSDGHRLLPQLISTQFPTMEEMREGRGEIHLEWSAELPDGSGNRSLNLENHHLSQIAAYQVNCLVPGDADIRIAAQNRNYSQSVYRLEYVEKGIPGDGRAWLWMSPLGVLLVTRLVYLRRRSGQVDVTIRASASR